MPLSVRQHVYFWSAAVLGLLAIVLIFKSVLLPFVLGAAVAYFLEPVVSSLGRYKLARGPAALIIVAIFYIILSLMMAVLMPVIYRQSVELMGDIPDYIDKVASLVQPYSERALSYLGMNESADWKALITGNSEAAKKVAGSVLGGLAATSQVALDVISMLVITPIVSYFMMKEWLNIKAWLEDILPRNSKSTILDLMAQINTKLAGFIRGQLIVSAVLGISYAIALSLAGLKYGFLIGLMAGVLSIIPLVGSTVGLLVSVGVAWFQSGELSYVAIIAAIFLIGQLIEGNILSPKLVGDSVGMHPLWVFFALMAGGALFGILGMLLAVPVAAVAGVLLAFGLTRYKMSALYKGKSTPKITDQPPEKPKA